MPEQDLTLRLTSEASEWELATPVGCGSLGGMLYGGVTSERLQLNEEFIWAGEKQTLCGDGFLEALLETRRLLLEGRGPEADAYAEQALSGKFGRVRSYESAGELLLSIAGEGEPSDYRRELRLIEGVASVSYRRGGIGYTRTLFASHPRRLLTLRLTADQHASVSFEAVYERPHLRAREQTAHGWRITGETADALHTFTVAIDFYSRGGRCDITPDRVSVQDADACEIYIAIHSHETPVLPDNPDFDALLEEHIADFSARMGRCGITLDHEDPALEALGLETRLARWREGKEDHGLVALYFQFGRYLLLSSSRPGTLPANLQGVWNGAMEAPWNSDYHTNINLQMNYWPAEVANLSECALPLFDYVRDYLLESGRETAHSFYHCRGAVLHHLSDIYGFTAPADGLWGLWPLGGAWLCFHFWEHYLFTGDREFLEREAYPAISAYSRFFLDYMFEDGAGRLLSGPSTSPENRYFCGDRPAYLCLSPTMDVEIIGGLLRIYLACEAMLNQSPDMAREAREALAKMPPLRIGKHGQLMEWLEDYDEPEPGHRHISHVFALYPGCDIRPDTPALFEAVRKTLERRESNGGGHTGWSRAWLIALHARLRDAKGAMRHLRLLLANSTRDNLFDTHPPFQIDGNFGGCAAIAEMLVQSHGGEIVLLPALPDEWPDGAFRGLCVRGGGELSARWENGAITEFTLYSRTGGDYRVVCGEQIFSLSLAKGASIRKTL